MPDPGCVLVVEDEVLIAMNIASELEDAGWRVAGPAGTVPRALALLDEGGVTAALLDMKLGAERSFPIADRLKAEGIPFMFLTGGTAQDLPDRFGGIPVLDKPIRFDRLLMVMQGWTAPAAGTASP